MGAWTRRVRAIFLFRARGRVYIVSWDASDLRRSLEGVRARGQRSLMLRVVLGEAL